MRRPLIFSLLLLAVVLPVQAVEPQRATTPQVRQWIAQLDHDDFAQRELAAARLARAGQAAIGPLAEGVVSLNPEVAWRCSEALERIAMEGDEATMDQVVKVLTVLSSRGKPQLAQFAAQMRDRQRVFRHNRAAVAIRQLGGQVAGGGPGVTDSELTDSDVVTFEAAPAIAALERIVIDEEPALELAEPAEPSDLEVPASEVKPVWLELLEALKIVKAGAEPKWERIEIGEDPEGVLALAEPKIEEQPAAQVGEPAIADRVAAAVLPGKVGGALRHAFGLRRIEGSEEKPATAEVAKGFSLPALEEGADEPAAAIAAAKEAKEAADAVEAAGEAAVDAAELVDVGVVGGPIFFGGGMVMGFDAGASPGYMTLGSEWRGGDAGLKHLKDLSGITTLQIERAPLTDAALPHIARMKSLTYVSIRGGKFSREALRTFHRQRPKVSLMAMGEGMMGVNGAFNTDGCILDSVMEGTAAHEAGLQAGDKVTSIAGESVSDFSELTIAVSTRKPGDKLKIVYERGGEQRQTDLTLKARPAGQ